MALISVYLILTPFSFDFGGNSAYPTENLVRESNYNIIAKSIQYRLGLFGGWQCRPTRPRNETIGDTHKDSYLDDKSMRKASSTLDYVSNGSHFPVLTNNVIIVLY